MEPQRHFEQYQTRFRLKIGAPQRQNLRSRLDKYWRISRTARTVFTKTPENDRWSGVELLTLVGNIWYCISSIRNHSDRKTQSTGTDQCVQRIISTRSKVAEPTNSSSVHQVSVGPSSESTNGRPGISLKEYVTISGC